MGRQGNGRRERNSALADWNRIPIISLAIRHSVVYTVVPMHTVEYCLKKAAEFDERAANCSTPFAIEAFARLADRWRAFALETSADSTDAIEAPATA
jgi:hypothetical protein